MLIGFHSKLTLVSANLASSNPEPHWISDKTKVLLFLRLANLNNAESNVCKHDANIYICSVGFSNTLALIR